MNDNNAYTGIRSVAASATTVDVAIHYTVGLQCTQSCIKLKLESIINAMRYVCTESTANSNNFGEFVDHTCNQVGLQLDRHYDGCVVRGKNEKE